MSITDSILFPSGTRQTDRKYYESGVRGRYEGNLRIERGTIDTSGPSITAGVGFTLVKNTTGDVTITFNPPFSATMSIVPTGSNSANIINVTVVSQAADTARLARTNRSLGDTPQDGEISFVAIGPS